MGFQHLGISPNQELFGITYCQAVIHGRSSKPTAHVAALPLYPCLAGWRIVRDFILQHYVIFEITGLFCRFAGRSSLVLKGAA